MCLSPRLAGLRHSGNGRGTRVQAGLRHERGKVVTYLLFVEPQLVVKKIKQLLLHEIDFSDVKKNGVIGPMHILRR